MLRQSNKPPKRDTNTLTAFCTSKSTVCVTTKPNIKMTSPPRIHMSQVGGQLTGCNRKNKRLYTFGESSLIKKKRHFGLFDGNTSQRSSGAGR